MRFNRLESAQLEVQVKSVGQTAKENMNTAFLFLDECTYEPLVLAEQGIMSEKSIPVKGSISFEALKKLNEHGAEFWSARELQPLLGYSQWRRFKEAILSIERGVTICLHPWLTPCHACAYTCYSPTERVVLECWDEMQNHFPHVGLYAFVVMPNHVHGIFVLNDDGTVVGATHASPGFGLRMGSTDRATHASPGFGLRMGSTDRATHASPLRGPGPKPRSIGSMVGSFKSAATKRINQTRNTSGTPVWQRNFYERIIRDERELAGIRRYIADNPAKWVEDENHLARQSPG